MCLKSFINKQFIYSKQRIRVKLVPFKPKHWISVYDFPKALVLNNIWTKILIKLKIKSFWIFNIPWTNNKRNYLYQRMFFSLLWALVVSIPTRSFYVLFVVSQLYGLFLTKKNKKKIELINLFICYFEWNLINKIFHHNIQFLGTWVAFFV